MADLAIVVLGRNSLRSKGDPVDRTPDVLGQVQVVTLTDDMGDADIGKAVLNRGNPHRVQQVAITVDVNGEFRIFRKRESNAATTEFFRHFEEKLAVLRRVEIYPPVGAQMVLTVEGKGYQLGGGHHRLAFITAQPPLFCSGN